MVPIASLTALADTPATRFVRMPYRPVALEPVVSQGVALIGADEWQAESFTGAGVKVAILDAGFQGYTERQAEGELPASLVVKSFRGDEDITRGGQKNGTGCAEVVYDIAPDTEMYLVNYDIDVEMGNAIDCIIAEGIDIVSVSLRYYVAGPGDGTGSICEEVDRAHAAGILWVNAMGNEAQCHGRGDFVNMDEDYYHEFNPPKCPLTYVSIVSHFP
jgi:hypothetical protein